MVGDLNRAERAYHDEPDRHDRTEDLAEPAGPAMLEGEEEREDQARDRQHRGFERGRGHLETLDCGEDRDRRRDDPIAVQQRRACDHQKRDDPDHATLGATRPLGQQRQQREYAALAVIVGAHDDDDVFERHHHRQRPEDQ